MKKILFLCTGNSCRSQIAEGWGIELLKDSYEFYSAGIETHGINKYAVKVMQESGVDISSHSSDNVSIYSDVPFDLVITLCDNANETCPTFPGTKVIHKNFEDPPKLAVGLTVEEEILACYRPVRDSIKEFILTIPLIFEIL